LRPFVTSVKTLAIIYQHFYPDFSAGGPVTSIGNLAEAMTSQMQVRVIASNTVYSTGLPMEGITSDAWTTWNNIPVWYASSRHSMKTAIDGLPEDTLIWLNGIFLPTWFLVPLRLARQKNFKVIISPRGMLQRGALKGGNLKKRAFLWLLNAFWLKGSEHWHATDEEEARDVQQWIRRRGGVTVIPNLPRPAVDKPAPLAKVPGQLRLVYYSLISRKKNLAFLLDLLREPSLSAVTLDIAGPVKDPLYWEECKSQIQALADPSKVKYLGELDPSGLSAFLSTYHLFVLPTEGENFGHAIMEALACGRPVCISNRTPWKDVEAAGAGFALELDRNTWLRTIVSISQWDQDAFDRSTTDALNYFAANINRHNLVQAYCELLEVKRS
jgi:glycosyltransferase involved in cell wall biosynthesis